MKTRWLAIGFAVLVVVGVGAAVWLTLPVERSESVLDDIVAPPTTDSPVSDEQFAELVRTDPIASLQESLRAYAVTTDGFAAEFRKRERRNGKLGEEEVIEVAVKDDPYSVLMLWKKGGGLGQGTLYVRGANDGKMKVWVGKLFVKNEDPQGSMPRSSARYTIEEFGIAQSTRKTLLAWVNSKERNELKFEYLGRKVADEAGGRECFVLKRICPADQIDPFISGGDPVPVTDANRPDSFRTVTVYLDCETRLQVGTEQHRHDGELTASYWFRDVKLNPGFDADTFTTKSFK